MYTASETHIIYKNGQPIRPEAAATFLAAMLQTPVAFESIRAYATGNGTRLFKAKEHLARLQKSCESINLHQPINAKEIIGDIYHALENHHMKNARVRVMVFAEAGIPSIVFMLDECVVLPAEKGLRLKISKNQRHFISTETNVSAHYLMAMMACNEAKAAGFDDALLTDINGRIAQASTANIFMQKGNTLYTPSTGNIFAGITRENVLDLCRKLEIEVIETNLNPDDVLNADSAFICSTHYEITGIESINQTKMPLNWKDSLGYTLQCAYKNRVLERENFEVII